MLRPALDGALLCSSQGLAKLARATQGHGNATCHCELQAGRARHLCACFHMPRLQVAPVAVVLAAHRTGLPEGFGAPAFCRWLTCAMGRGLFFSARAVDERQPPAQALSQHIGFIPPFETSLATRSLGYFPHCVGPLGTATHDRGRSVPSRIPFRFGGVVGAIGFLMIPMLARHVWVYIAARVPSRVVV